jgi:hypothetical protein
VKGYVIIYSQKRINQLFFGGVMNAEVATVIDTVITHGTALLVKMIEATQEMNNADAAKMESSDLLKLRLEQVAVSQHVFDISIKELRETRAAVIEAQRAELEISRMRLENERMRLQNQSVKPARRARW